MANYSRGINSDVASRRIEEFYNDATGKIPHRDVPVSGNRQMSCPGCAVPDDDCT